MSVEKELQRLSGKLTKTADIFSQSDLDGGVERQMVSLVELIHSIKNLLGYLSAHHHESEAQASIAHVYSEIGSQQMAIEALNRCISSDLQISDEMREGLKAEFLERLLRKEEDVKTAFLSISDN